MVQQQAHYNDDTPNNFPDDYDETKVDSRVKLRSKAIRGKNRGVDVRGALAQGIEIAGAIAGESVQSATDAKSMSQDTQNRFDDQINGKVDPDEVIDARRPTGGDAYPTLGKRLDKQDEKLADTDPEAAKAALAYLNNDAIEVGGVRPSYYTEKLASIAGIISVDTFNLGLITDNHHQEDLYSPGSLSHYANISALSRVAPIDVIVAGGDNINGDHSRNQTLVETRQATSTLYYRTAFDTDVFFAFGNHDTGAFQGSGGEDKTRPENCIRIDEIKSFYNAKNPLFGEVRDDSSLYFYKDYSEKKVRLIVLNSFDLPETLKSDGTYRYNFLEQSAFGSKQLRWLANEALMLPASDWQVVIFSHACISGGLDTIPQINTTSLITILNAFQAGVATPVTEDSDFPVDITADFTAQGQGTIIAFISGHKHADGQMVYKGVNCIESLASLCFKGDVGREAGTETEDAWDIFQVDTTSRSIHISRFGAGEDRSFTY